MIERLSESLATAIKNNGGDESVSHDVLKFALYLLLSIFSIFLLASLTGYLLSTLYKVYLSLIAIGTLRYFSGGWHLKTALGCILFTVAVVSCISVVPELPVWSQWSMCLLSLLLVLTFAPTGHGQHFRSQAHRKRFKWIAIAIVTASLLMNDSTISVSILCQSLTLIIIKRRSTHEKSNSKDTIPSII